MDEITIDDYAFVIGDTETTGLPPGNAACEVALREICPVSLETRWELRSLIDPEIEIGEKAAEIHGITQDMVADEPTMQEFVEHRLGPDRINGRKIVLICHNVRFDKPLLAAIGQITNSICTLEHARRLWPKGTPNGPSDHKLQTLREHFRIPANNAHSALDDVHITHEVLRHILEAHGRTLLDLAFEGPVVVHRMPFGEHAGKLLMDMPADYLRWMLTKDFDPNLKRSVQRVLDLR